MSCQQKREDYRITKVLPVEVAFGASTTIKASTRDISGGGVRLVAQERLDTGASVVCRLAVHKYCPMEVKGTVIWSKSVENEDGPSCFETAIRFSHDESDKCEEIVKFIFEEQNRIIKTSKEIDQSRTDIWDRYVNDRCTAIRNEILMKYVHLVKIIVSRLIPSYKKVMEYDDVISCGVLGLIDAIERFDPGRNIKFETYASIRIRGEIIDFMRKQDWVPLSVRNRIKKVVRAYGELEVLKGGAVTDEEIAGHLGISVDELQKTLENSYTANVLYLDEAISVIDTDRTLDEQGDPIGSQYELTELKEQIAGILDTLSDNERLVITLYYYEEMTLKEIGMVLGVSESRVSQIHSKVLMKLRARLSAG